MRHNFASRSVDQNFSLSITGSLIGHKDRRSTARYAHLGKAPAVAAVNSMASSLASDLGIKMKKQTSAQKSTIKALLEIIRSI